MHSRALGVSAKTWLIRGVAIVAGATLLLLVVVLALHTAPARNAVLRRAVLLLADRFNLALTAENLQYNLITRRVSMSRVTLAATHAPRDPFLTADRIEVTVPSEMLLGTVAIDHVRLENARLVIHRQADGSSNLPSSESSDDEGPPSALPVQRIEIPRLAIEVADAGSGVSLSLPNMAVDIRPAAGQLRLVEPGRMALASKATTVKTLGGGVAFDGRSVRVSQFTVATDETDATLDGDIALLVRDPNLDLRVSGKGNVAELARWATSEAVPAGTVTFDAAIKGLLPSPVIDARVRSDALAYQGLTVSRIDAALKVDSNRLEATRVEMALADGQLTAAGQLSFGSSTANLTASWADVSLEQLVRMVTNRRSPVPAGRATGGASFTGALSDLATWTLEVTNRIVAAPGSAGLLPVGGEASFNVAESRWRLQGMHVVAAAGIGTELMGNVVPNDVMQSSLTGTIDARDADLSRLMTTLSEVGLLDRATTNVVTGRLDAVASLSGTIAKPAIQLNASGRGLSAFDVPDITIDANATGDLDQAVVEARVRQSSANTIEIKGTVWPNASRLDTRITGSVSDWSALATAPVSGTADIRLDARGPFKAITATGSVSMADARYGDAALGPLDAQVGLDAGVARIALSAPDFGAKAQAALRLEGSRSGVVDMQIVDASIERLLQTGGLAADLSGRFSLTAHAEGALDNWQHAVASVEVGSLDGRSGALAIRLQEPARVWYDGGTLDVLSLETTVGETRLSVDGRYAVVDDAPVVASGDALRGVLVGDLSHILDAVGASGFGDAIDVSGKGPVVLLTRVNGKGQQPLLSADLELGPAEVTRQDLPPVSGVQVRARVADGWAEIVSASADWQKASVTLQGRVPLRLLDERIPNGLFSATDTVSGAASLDLRAVSVTAQALSPFLPPESIAQIDGALDATVHLEASSLDWASLQGEARLDRFEVTVAGVSLAQQETTRIAIEKGIARPASWNWSGRGTSLVVQGEVRLPEQRAALLAGGQVDLRLLTAFLPGTDIAIGGSAMPQVSISGPLDDLRIEGDVTVADGEIRLREPGVIVTSLTVDASLGRDQARITRLDGQINGGSLTGTGDLMYGGQGGLSGSVQTTISGMGLDFPEGLRSELDAGLTLEVKSDDEGLAGTLNGTVTVLRSAYREPIGVVTQLLSALRAERLAAAATPGTTERSFADRLQLNVRLVTDTDVIVDNNLARLQLGGDLRVIGTAAAPALSGRATLREGGELFIGTNRYTIDSGTIDFANPVTIEPDLNVQAQTRAGGEDIELTIKGTPETMSVDMRSPSDPQLGQADIASLLLTGRTLDNVSGAEAEIVGEQLLSYVSGDVLGAASRVVGLDTIRIGGVDPSLRRGDPADIASQADPTSRLTFGKSFGESFDVTLSQSLREGGAQTWIIDYSPISRLDLRYVSNDENLRSYQFRHDVSIGGPTRRPRATSTATREVRHVTAVELTGELGGPEERLRRVIGIEPGDEFDFTAWQRDRDRIERVLHNEGRLEARVSARRQDTADGVAISYQIDAGPMTSIRYTGDRPSDQIISAIQTAWSHSIFDDALVAEVKGIVQRSLAERGYFQPTVMATMTGTDTKILDVVVDLGQRAAERRLLVNADNEALTHDIEQWARRSGAEEQAWRDGSGFQRALVQELRRRGHVSPDVRVAPPRSDGGVGVVRVDVRAGPVVTVGAVSFTGAERVASERLQQAAGIELGAPYDATAVDRARERVLRVMRGEGFVEARVVVNVHAEPNGQVTIVFAILQGPMQMLREIRIAGNRSIDRDVIVRTLDMNAGDPLGADAWLRARSRLFDTALFRRVDVTAEPLPATDGERPMRLVVTVEEWPALRVRYGLEVSEEHPEGDVEGKDLTPGFSADVTRRTLFGRAITVGGVVEYQSRERLARGFLNTPTLFGRRVESLLSVERSHEEVSEASFVTDRHGVSWEQRVRIGTRLRVSYAYTYDKAHTFSTRLSDDPFNPTFDVTVNIARLASAAVFDSRNNPLETTRGWLLSSNLEYAPSMMGSDIRFVRYLTQAYHFQSVKRLVLASAARLGLATALEGQTLIPSERFYAGGARTVRGVSENGLGPRDIFGDAAGGGALVVFNQEVRFPLFRWFGGVGFVDLGNVFESPRSIDFADLVGSFGGGLRVSTPFALLRADVARLWSPEVGQPTARWTFGIGHTF